MITDHSEWHHLIRIEIVMFIDIFFTANRCLIFKNLKDNFYVYFLKRDIVFIPVYVIKPFTKSKCINTVTF